MIKRLTEESSLKFKSLSPEEKEARGIKGRLYGPVASFASPTRNGRKYTQELWEKLFNSDLIKERFRNGGIFGQLCHPDYEDVDMEKVAIIMPEPPVKDSNGDLIAYVDILDTPCGKIAYQLAKYGYNFGISSRGTGDLIDGPDGEEVDPDSYNLTAFDLVEVPAVENARLSFTESLDKKKYNKTLRQSLNEELEKASDSDRALMEESLKNMNITLNESKVFTQDAAGVLHDYNVIAISYDEKTGKRLFKADTRPNPTWIPEDAVYSVEITPEAAAALTAKKEADKKAGKSDAKDELPDANPTVTDEKDVPADDDVDITEGVGDNVKQAYSDIVKLGSTLFKGDNTKLNNFLRSMKDLSDASRRSKLAEEADIRVNEALNVGEGEEAEIYKDFVENTYDELVKNFKAYVDSQRVGDNVDGLDDDYSIEQIIKGMLAKAQGRDIFGDNVFDEECDNESCADKEVVESKADNVGELKELQEALVKSNKLEKDNLSLQEKLSVSTTKVKDLEEELKKYKASTASLSETAKQVRPLKEELASVTGELNKSEDDLKSNKLRLEKFKSNNVEIKKNLNESIAKAEDLSNQIESLNEELKKYKLACNSYKAKLKESKEAYVKARADAIGVKPTEILSKLSESYKLKDVDSVCEDLSKYRNTISKLPFVVNESTHLSAKPSNEYIAGRNPANSDDYISDSLLKFIQ